MSARKTLNVVTGIILYHKSLVNGVVADPRKMEMLLGKRSKHGSNAGLWEHFGGKVEDKDATLEDALSRELFEELGEAFMFDIKRFLFKSQYIPPDEEYPIIDLNVFLVHHIDGHVQLTREHEDCGWIKLDTLEHMVSENMISPADISIIEWLQQNKWNINDGLWN